jgi:hypothetical protein
MATRIGFCVVGMFLLAACGTPPPPPKRPPAPKAAAQAVPDAPAGSISRAALEVVLRHGPPWILQRVPIEEVLEKGKFKGWRVTEVPLDWDADLQAGDVVTRVNAMPLETPNDFWAAWTTLTVASELKVAYLRDGEQREIAIPIHGSPNPAVASELQKRPQQREDLPTEESPVKANQRYNKSKQFKTIVIPPTERYDSDTNVDWSDQP